MFFTWVVISLALGPVIRHAHRFHELAQAVAHVDLLLLIADRGADNVRQDDPRLAAGWHLLFLVDDVVFLFWIYQNAGLDQNRSLAMLRFKSVLCLRKWFLWEENLGHDCRHVGNVFVGEDLGCFAEVCQVLPPTWRFWGFREWFICIFDQRYFVELGQFPLGGNFRCVR